MSDFLTGIIQASGPIARDVTINGETGAVYFRYLTGEQRLQLTKGKRFAVKKGENPTIEIDLGDNETEKQKMVLFCVVTDDGKPRFKDVAEVRTLAGHVIDALYLVAQAVNKAAAGEDETPGES